MDFIHQSRLTCHGNLTSLNCIITSRFVLKIAQCGYLPLFYHIAKQSHSNIKRIRLHNVELAWKPPEAISVRGDLEALIKAIRTKECDMFAVGTIYGEVLHRRMPFNVNIDSESSMQGPFMLIIPKSAFASLSLYHLYFFFNRSAAEI